METDRPSPVDIPNSVEDISNKDFNDWHVEYYVGRSKYGDSLWLCRCKCGKYVSVIRTNIVKGYSKRCTKCGHKRHGYNINESISHPVFRSILTNAKKRNIPVQITKQYLTNLFHKQQGKCAITGINITLPTTAKEYLSSDFTASLDRTDNKLGYIECNVQWVHKKINLMKGKLSMEEFKKWCKLVVDSNQ